jgi:hypothetical protein
MVVKDWFRLCWPLVVVLLDVWFRFPGLLLRGVTCCADLHLAFYLGIWGRIQFPLGGGSAMKIVYAAVVSVPCA